MLEQWSAVDDYITDILVKPDAALERALDESAKAGMPAFNVTPAQGKMLHLIAQIHGARRILEIGMLGGYSTIWLARALPPDGKLVSLEHNKKYAAVARANLEYAGVDKLVDIRIGTALNILPALEGPFDLIFIDADKPGNPDYFQWALKLSRPGSVIIVDNVVRNGEVTDADSDDASVQGVRRMNELITAEPRVSATAIQTVGSKGYDGFTLMHVLR
jgi:predicted O-methyltransferase YrrM